MIFYQSKVYEKNDFAEGSKILLQIRK